MSLRPALSRLKNKKDLIGVEIGVWQGAHAHCILKQLDIKKLYLIDPYTYYDYYWSYKGLNQGMTPDQHSEHINTSHQLAVQKLSEFNDRIEWIIDFSSNAVHKFNPRELDFVYIDGCHNYTYVKEDIKLYTPLIKHGGMLAGHDYSNIADVKRAVDELVPDAKKSDRDWWIIL